MQHRRDAPLGALLHPAARSRPGGGRREHARERGDRGYYEGPRRDNFFQWMREEPADPSVRGPPCRTNTGAARGLGSWRRGLRTAAMTQRRLTLARPCLGEPVFEGRFRHRGGSEGRRRRPQTKPAGTFSVLSTSTGPGRPSHTRVSCGPVPRRPTPLESS